MDATVTVAAGAIVNPYPLGLPEGYTVCEVCGQSILEDISPHYHVPIGGGHTDVCLGCALGVVEYGVETLDAFDDWPELFPVNGAQPVQFFDEYHRRDTAH